MHQADAPIFRIASHFQGRKSTSKTFERGGQAACPEDKMFNRSEIMKAA
jgi:hypothetical protein